MNRREFMKSVGASGMVAIAPATVSTKASANDLIPVGQYFVFAHLSGGWEPSTFCNPQSNLLRSDVAAEIGVDPNSVSMGASPVNRYPASSVRAAADVYVGSANVSSEMKYAPYLGTFNQRGSSDELDDGTANNGFTTQHIQQILSGSIAGDVLTAAPTSGFAWLSTASAEVVQANAKAILEGDVNTVELGAIATDELVDRNLSLNGTQIDSDLFVYDAFYCLYADQIRIVNGIDNRTNSHDTGTMYADTGSMAAGYPDFSALYAAVHGADRPLAWMTDGGGNDEHAGLVARSTASNANIFDVLADPLAGQVDPFLSYLETAQAQRESLQAQKETLPIRRKFQDQLYMVRETGVEFADLAAEINAPAAGSLAEEVMNASQSSRQDHLRIGVAGFATGLASSMQVGFGGFDTHGDHDDSHYPSIRSVLIDLHYLFRALDAYDVTDQTTVVIGSDFGRTPWYNDGDGKDHWAVTSYMLMGNGVDGGTAINATNPLLEAKNVDISTLAPLESGGILMTASHLHRELRKVAGILDHEYSQLFPIEAEDMSIFG